MAKCLLAPHPAGEPVTGHAQSAVSAFPEPAARTSKSLWIVAGLLVLSELTYLAMVRLEAVSTAKSVFTFLALMAVLFGLYTATHRFLLNLREQRGALALIIIGAVLFRFTLLFAGLPQDNNLKETITAARADIRGEAVTYDSFLVFDNDIWRYIWDGHVGARGINPFLYEPGSPRLDALTSGDRNALWGDIRANINHSDVPTIYPPLAQLVFLAAHWLAPGSVFVMKSLLVAFDLLTCLFVVLTLRAIGQPVTDVVLYAWNPLVIKEVAASGHMDPLLAALLVATVYFVVRGLHSAAGLTWGLSVLAKISPIVLLPFLLQRIGARKSALGLAVVMAGYLPFLDRNGSIFVGLRTFAAEWQFNSGLFSLVEWAAQPFSSIPSLVAKITAAVILLMLLSLLIWKDDGDDKTFALYSVTALGVLVVLSPAVMPWYLVWIVPLSVIARSRVWIQFSALVCLAFLVMIDGTERPVVLWLEFGAFAVLAWREYSLNAHRHMVLDVP